MNRKRLIAFLLTLMLLLFAVPTSQAAPTDTVYVRKHISLVYDNSGSMRLQQSGIPNLKWTYASYAAQIFAGLLNESDSLDITLMNPVMSGGAQTKTLSIDLTGDRQQQVDKLREVTTVADGETPLGSVADAESVLTKIGLLADEQIGDNGINKDEQYWLVLTTDGRFENGNITEAELENELERLLKKYSNLQLVYFGIGTEGDQSTQVAYNLENSRLTSYPNFTAVYAEKQEQIVDTMQVLANRISGRYSVTDGVQFDGSQITLYVSGETSPVRNIAILAQKTDSKLLQAVDGTGTQLTVVRPSSEQYPFNTDPGYDNMDEGTKGAHTALITHPDGKFKPGTVTLTFSEPVSQEDFSLMYEPAVFVKLTVQQKDDAGNWMDVPYGQKVQSGRPLRVGYEICEDGTNTPLDAAKLPGVATEHITCGDEVLKRDGEFIAPSGTFNIAATVSLMDGAYSVSTVRTLQAVSLSDYSFKVSDPLTFYPDELAANVDQYIDFTVLYDGKPATAEQLTEFTVDAGDLKGVMDNVNGGFRFTPKHDECQPGEMTVQLSFQGQVVASQTVTVKEYIVTYEAVANNDLTLFSNEVAGNTTPVAFSVICTKGDQVGPLPEEEAGDFRMEAKAADGTVLKGVTVYEAGQLHFVASDTSAQPGEYTVTLYRQDTALASAHISILKYNAQFTAKVFRVGDGTVDLFDLRHNESALAFVVYADGEPCTGVQLEGMMGSMLSLEHDCPAGIMKLDISVGTHQGEGALLVRPTSTAKTALGHWFKKISIAPKLLFGILTDGPLTVELTVQAEKGAQVSGTLDMVHDPAAVILYLIILLVILAIVLLIAYLLFCCVHKPRILPGVLRYYKLEKDDATYLMQTKTHDEIRWKFSFNTRPEIRQTAVYMQLQAPASNDSALFRAAADPLAVITYKDKQLDGYFYHTNGHTSHQFLTTLNQTARGNRIRHTVVQSMMGTPASNAIQPLKPGETGTYTPRLRAGALLIRKTVTGSKCIVEVWSYETTGRNNNGNQPNRIQQIR